MPIIQCIQLAFGEMRQGLFFYCITAIKSIIRATAGHRSDPYGM